MKVKLKEVRERINKPIENGAQWFSIRVARRMSVYLSWLFIRLDIKGDQVLIFDFIVELIGVLLFLMQQRAVLLTAVFLLFFGFVLDHVDGDVRRFWNETKAWGVFLDRIMHRIIYPLTYITIGMHCYLYQGKLTLLFFGISAAFFNQLNSFNYLFKQAILGYSIDTPTATKRIRNHIADKTNPNNISFISLLFVKRIYDHIFCNWLQYIILVPIILLGQLKFFIITYGVLEPLNWLFRTFLDIRYDYIPAKIFYKKGKKFVVSN